MMNKIFEDNSGLGRRGIVIAVIVVAAVLAVFFTLRLPKKETIKIGAIIPFSGAAAHHAAVSEGMRLAADEINSWGGINGREIEFIVEDSKSDREEGKKAFNRIEAAHHPLLYVSTTSSVSMALAPLAEENEVVLVGLVTITPALTRQREWIFKYFTLPETEVQPILYILSDLNVKELGILYQNDEYGTSVYELLKKEFEENGGTVRSEAYDTEASDYKKQIANLKDMEAIYAVGWESRTKNVFRQLREENYRGIILISSGASSPDVRSMPEANGVYVTAPLVYNPDFLFAKELKEKYETEYNKPLTQYAANGYDFVKLLAGLLQDKEVSRENVRAVLEEGFMYPGVFGVLDVKPGEHEIFFPLYPARIVDGEIEYLTIK